jgi:hypothetical protein
LIARWEIPLLTTMPLTNGMRNVITKTLFLKTKTMKVMNISLNKVNTVLKLVTKSLLRRLKRRRRPRRQSLPLLSSCNLLVVRRTWQVLTVVRLSARFVVLVLSTRKTDLRVAENSVSQLLKKIKFVLS